jgi:hypothetical protein
MVSHGFSREQILPPTRKLNPESWVSCLDKTLGVAQPKKMIQNFQ